MIELASAMTGSGQSRLIDHVRDMSAYLEGQNLSIEISMGGGAKRLSLLHDLLPAASTFAVIINPTNPLVSEGYLKDMRTAARTLGWKIVVVLAQK
jgi:hypothetical protein